MFARRYSAEYEPIVFSFSIASKFAALGCNDDCELDDEGGSGKVAQRIGGSILRTLEEPEPDSKEDCFEDNDVLRIGSLIFDVRSRSYEFCFPYGRSGGFDRRFGGDRIESNEEKRCSCGFYKQNLIYMSCITPKLYRIAIERMC